MKKIEVIDRTFRATGEKSEDFHFKENGFSGYQCVSIVHSGVCGRKPHTDRNKLWTFRIYTRGLIF